MNQFIFRNKHLLFPILLIFIILLNIISFNYFINNFKILEKKENKKNISLFINKLEQNIAQLKNTSRDYSNWDDTYNFIRNKNKDFINKNFKKEFFTLENTDIDFMIFVDINNNLLYSTYSIFNEVENKTKFNNFITEQKIEGNDIAIIKYLNKYLYLLKSPIKKSNLTGPINGFLYSGRMINTESLSELFSKNIEIVENISFKADYEIESKDFKNIEIKNIYEYNKLANFITFFNKTNKLITIKLINNRQLYREGKRQIIVFNIIITFFCLLIYFISYRFINYQENINSQLEKRIQSEIKKSKEQEHLLIQQSKLASMGEMINNIAHQWRQPLNALGLTIQNIKFQYEMGELNDEYIKNAINKTNLLINNMSKTIDDFRNFFKPVKQKKYFNINKVLDSSLNIVNTSLETHNIIIKKNYQENLTKIHNYENEFSQVLLNIINNAKDALIEKEIKDAIITLKTFQKDEFLYIHIQDNAKGIKEEMIDKIFEPYFTTKFNTNGTGIGLYMSKIIIEKNMKGKLSVKSNKKGSTFIIEIPIN